MREAQNIREVARLGVDMMGFIFYPKSPRYVQQPIERSKEDEKLERVGVFVNESIENILKKVREYDLNCIQLHGSESKDFCQELRTHFNGRIFKAISVNTAEDVGKVREYSDNSNNSSIDLFLFDTKCKSMGGSGQQFDWSVLNVYDGKIPFMLSGGIGLDDVERVRTFHHPRCIGVDLNSKFEIEPGLKDVKRLKKFIERSHYEPFK